MALDTQITGSPASIEGAASWAKGTLAPAVDKGGDALVSAKSLAESDWDGTAGQEFASSMKSATTKTDDLHAGISTVVEALDTYASALRSLQDRMATIRHTASAAGLTVSGYSIEDPGPGPSRPGDMTVTTDTPKAAIDAHDSAVAAYDAHQDKVRAWNKAVTDAGDVRADAKAAGSALQDRYRGLSGASWVLTAADITGGFGGAVGEFNASALKGTSDIFKSQAATNLSRALAADPATVGSAQWYKDIDDATRAGQYADDLAKGAEGLDKSSKMIPLKLGGALAVVGIGYEISQGKDPTEAVVSGTGGFLASVGAATAVGAGIGTLIPVPGVGTAVGAVVGAGVGIFTSGAIDSLFENGPDVGEALDSGVDAIKDTGGAIVGGVKDVGGAIGGLFH